MPTPAHQTQILECSRRNRAATRGLLADGAQLVSCKATPHAVFLARSKRPVGALGHDRTASARPRGADLQHQLLLLTKDVTGVASRRKPGIVVSRRTRAGAQTVPCDQPLLSRTPSFIAIHGLPALVELVHTNSVSLVCTNWLGFFTNFFA